MPSRRAAKTLRRRVGRGLVQRRSGFSPASGGPRNRTSSQGFGDPDVAVTPVPHGAVRAIVDAINLRIRPPRLRTSVRAKILAPTRWGLLTATYLVFTSLRATLRRIPHLPPRDHLLRRLSGACRGMPGLDDADGPAPTSPCRGGPAAAMRSRGGGQEPVAGGVTAARAWAQARPQDRARGLAAQGGRPVPARVPARAAALGRVPDGEPVQDASAERADCRVRVSALVLL